MNRKAQIIIACVALLILAILLGLIIGRIARPGEDGATTSSKDTSDVYVEIPADTNPENVDQDGEMEQGGEQTQQTTVPGGEDFTTDTTGPEESTDETTEETTEESTEESTGETTDDTVEETTGETVENTVADETTDPDDAGVDGKVDMSDFFGDGN